MAQMDSFSLFESTQSPTLNDFFVWCEKLLDSQNKKDIQLLGIIFCNPVFFNKITRVLSAYERDDLLPRFNKRYQEFMKRPQNFKTESTIPRLQKCIPLRIIKAVNIPPAANDLTYWIGVSDEVAQILNQYGISPAEVDIPPGQLNSLHRMYNMVREDDNELSKQDILDMIRAIPEILSISL